LGRRGGETVAVAGVPFDVDLEGWRRKRGRYRKKI